MTCTRFLVTLWWSGLLVTVGVAMTIKSLVNPSELEDEMLESNGFLSSPFTQDGIDELVDWHNFARSTVTPSASNMEYIDWDPYLEDIAQRWADKCLWEHGRPSDVVGYHGQNLWAITASGVVVPKAVVKAWDDEKHFYNYTSNSCKDGKQCGHYTQIVWSSTNSIGCGRAFCPNLKGAGKNMWIVVCQYSPGGNIQRLSPYSSGPTCSRCESGVGQCYQNLCRSCEEHHELCECRQLCHNCGTVDRDTCTCRCPQGFYGTDCSETCSNLHPYCGRSPGFPDSRFCNYHPIIPKLCPLMCGICSAPDGVNLCQEATTITTTEGTELEDSYDDSLLRESSESALSNNVVADQSSRVQHDAIEQM